MLRFLLLLILVILVFGMGMEAGRRYGTPGWVSMPASLFYDRLDRLNGQAASSDPQAGEGAAPADDATSDGV